MLSYSFVSLFLVPKIAPLFGREKIKNTELIKANSFIYILANRNYVVPELNNVLDKVSKKLHERYNGIQLVYLDANFPFFNGFPLLPHLSHDDGKKIDLSLVYEDKNGKLTNKKPSISGYGVFEGPKKGEFDQISICENKGKWQYDFPKHLTFGRINKNIEFSKKRTKSLILLIVQQRKVGKLFIEPHLKSRLRLVNKKIRYHGCQAVRHDDHIHLQLY